MRELKFRAWDKTANEFVDDFILDRLGNEYQTDKSEFWGDDRDIVLMQYTGLLDKEGKKIYEGDIVKHYSSGLDGCIGIVEFEDGMFQELLDLHDNDYDILNETVKVIGNIYENKELITK